MLRASHLLLFCCLVVPMTATAKPKVVLFPIVPISGEVEASAAQEMTRSVADEMKSQKTFDSVVGENPAVAVSTPDSGRAPARSDAAYRAALAELQDGAEQMKKLRIPQAIHALEKGIDGLRKNLELLDDYNRLIDAYLLLAVAHFRKGKESAGADVLEQLARLRPDYELDAAKYPPIFVNVFDKARARALERERGALRVTSAPAAAEVILNGREIGKTPILIEEVIPGENHLVVKVGERTAWSQVVEVRSGEPQELHANLGAGGPDAPLTLGDAMAANRFDRDVRQTARQKARDMGGDFVVVLAIGRGNGVFAVSGFLGNAKTGKWAALSPVAPDYDMLSASIEAHSLAREVTTQIENFGSDIGNDTVPFIAGKSIAAAKKSGGLAESRVAFVGGVARVSGGGGGRRPPRAVVSASADETERRPLGENVPEPPEPPKPAPMPPPQPAKTVSKAAAAADLEADIMAEASGGRSPVTSGAARQPPRPKENAEAAQRELQAEAAVQPAKGPRREPATAGGPRRALGQSGASDETPMPELAAVPAKKPHDKDHEHSTSGAVVGSGVGIEIDESDSPSREIAAVAPDGRTSALTAPNLEKEAGEDEPLIEKWWFWTAIGAGVAVIVVGSVLIFSNPDPTQVQVYAVW